MWPELAVIFLGDIHTTHSLCYMCSAYTSECWVWTTVSVKINVARCMLLCRPFLSNIYRTMFAMHLAGTTKIIIKTFEKKKLVEKHVWVCDVNGKFDLKQSMRCFDTFLRRPGQNFYFGAVQCGDVTRSINNYVILLANSSSFLGGDRTHAQAYTLFDCLFSHCTFVSHAPASIS